MQKKAQAFSCPLSGSSFACPNLHFRSSAAHRRRGTAEDGPPAFLSCLTHDHLISGSSSSFPPFPSLKKHLDFKHLQSLLQPTTRARVAAALSQSITITTLRVATTVSIYIAPNTSQSLSHCLYTRHPVQPRAQNFFQYFHTQHQIPDDYQSTAEMPFKFDVVLPLRIAQFVFAIIVMGLSGYGSSTISHHQNRLLWDRYAEVE